MNWLQKFFGIIENAMNSSERAMSLPQMYELLNYAMWENESSGYLIDVYREEDGNLFAISVDKGRLYKTSFQITGSDLTLGSPEEVVPDFVSTARSRGNHRIFRTADGKYRLVSVSCTSVLNRVGEIDARDLFDTFVNNIQRTGSYPYRTFYHLGETFRTGTVDFLAREGNVLISSTLYDDTDLARYEIEARQRDPDAWGDSIGYLPTSEPEILETAEGIRIPVYRSGIIDEISTLPEDSAASFFTGGKVEVRRMNANQKKAFAALVGSEEEAEKWLKENVEDLNRSIEQEGVITRAAEEDTAVSEEPAAEVPVEPETTPEEEDEDEAEVLEPAATVEYEIDEDVVRQISDHILGSDGLQDLIRELLSPVVELQKSVAQLMQDVTDLRASVISRGKEVDDRLGILEKSEEEAHEIWSNDLPRNTRRAQVTFRPREVATPSTEKPTLADVANQTLQKIK